MNLMYSMMLTCWTTRTRCEIRREKEKDEKQKWEMWSRKHLLKRMNYLDTANVSLAFEDFRLSIGPWNPLFDSVLQPARGKNCWEMLLATWFLSFMAVAKVPLRGDKESTIYKRTFGFSGLVPGFLNKGPCRTRYWTVGCPLAAWHFVRFCQEVSSAQVKLACIYYDHRVLHEGMFWTKTPASSIARSLGWEFKHSPSLDCLHRFAMFIELELVASCSMLEHPFPVPSDAVEWLPRIKISKDNPLQQKPSTMPLDSKLCFEILLAFCFELLSKEDANDRMACFLIACLNVSHPYQRLVYWAGGMWSGHSKLELRLGDWVRMEREAQIGSEDDV